MIGRSAICSDGRTLKHALDDGDLDDGDGSAAGDSSVVLDAVEVPQPHLRATLQHGVLFCRVRDALQDVVLVLRCSPR